MKNKQIIESPELGQSYALMRTVWPDLKKVTVKKLRKQGIKRDMKATKKTIEEKCDAIYKMVKESWTPDHRSFEEAEIASHIENIFENTKRIHGKSESLDWIRIASHKAASYIFTDSAKELINATKQ